MRQNESLRELNASEIDEVAGGLSVSVGANAAVGASANVNASDVLGAASGLVGQAGSLVSSLTGSVLGPLGGLTSAL